MSKRILFVDDEQNVLDGLRRMLRRRRGDWDMVFALGGEAALRELEHASFDILVTDMRMPGIDGAALLHHARMHYPHLVRVILSGYAEHASTFQVLPLAHRFLSKPCDPEVLQEVVDRAWSIQRVLGDQSVRDLLDRAGPLPEIPAAYMALASLSNEPDATVQDAARVLELHGAEMAPALELLRSGLLEGPSGPLASCGAFGLQALRGLVLLAGALDLFDAGELAPSRAALRHAVLASQVAWRLVTDPEDRPHAAVAALLHDVGAQVLANRLPAEWSAVLQASRQSARTLPDIERERWGATHAEVGGYLLALWGQPWPVVEAVALHHEPTAGPCQRLDVVGAVHAADALAGGTCGQETHTRIDRVWLAALRIEGAVPRWEALTSVEHARLAGVLGG